MTDRSSQVESLKLKIERIKSQWESEIIAQQKTFEVYQKTLVELIDLLLKQERDLGVLTGDHK